MSKGYVVTDEAALKAAYPQFFKAIPDGYKIRKALSLGIELPGVSRVEAVSPEQNPAEGQLDRGESA